MNKEGLPQGKNQIMTGGIRYAVVASESLGTDGADHREPHLAEYAA